MIEADRIWFSYDGRRWALKGASLRLRPGEVLAVIGPNGSGKTTLLKVSSGLYRPARGRVSIDGLDPWGAQGLEARRLVVYVHEKPIMLRGTVAYNIAYPLLLRGASSGEAEERAREAARLAGVDGILNRQARKLSAGQAQMVAVARALAAKPRYLLLDEPFAHLDPARRAYLARLIARLASEGVGVAVASHDTLLLESLASRVLVVEDGAAREARSLRDAYSGPA